MSEVEDKIANLKDKLEYIPQSFTLEEVAEYYRWLDLKEGMVVCDPFAGVGTVGVVGELLGIKTVNIELDKDTFNKMEKNFGVLKREVALGEIGAVRINGDSEFVELKDEFDGIITSPFFLFSSLEKPFTSLDQYGEYVDKLARIFARLIGKLKPDGQVLIEIGNDEFEEKVVPLKLWMKDIMEELGFEMIDERPVENLPERYDKAELSGMVFSRSKSGG